MPGGLPGGLPRGPLKRAGGLLAVVLCTLQSALSVTALQSSPPSRISKAQPGLVPLAAVPENCDNFRPKFRYACEVCSLRLEKRKHLEEHLRGKKHARALEMSEVYWQRYQQTSWADAAAPRSAVMNAFTFDGFLQGLTRRTRRGGPQPLLTSDGTGCISPHVSLADLDATKRAMLFRYLDDRYCVGLDRFIFIWEAKMRW